MNRFRLRSIVLCSNCDIPLQLRGRLPVRLLLASPCMRVVRACSGAMCAAEYNKTQQVAGPSATHEVKQEGQAATEDVRQSA